MSIYKDAVRGPSAQKPALSVARMVTNERHVKTYNRFISSFEADIFTDWIDESISFKTTCFIGDWS